MRVDATNNKNYADGEIMNVGRGLFRAWIVVSTLWAVGAGSMAYETVSPHTVRGSYQPILETKEELESPSDIDWTKPFYEIVRSPSAEKLSVTFDPLDAKTTIDWDKDATITKVDMPDSSRVYINANYNQADQDYIARQYWDQRWTRWGHAAAIVVLWALVPCALLLIVGYAVLWVARGFART